MVDQQVEHTNPKYIGIDIGGTNTRVGVFQSLELSTFELVAKFPTYQQYQQQLQAIIGAIQRSNLERIAGIGISIAGRIARDGRSVIIAPNLPEYVGQPFAQDIARQFRCPVYLAHDAVCGLLAEKKFGHIHNFDRCAYLTVSTGTGAAIKLSKASNTLTSSIEIGHQILDGNQRVCLCGQVGCLETFTGGKQITLRYGRSPAEITDTAFWENFCHKLALGLVNLAMLTRIDAITISGAIVLQNTFLQSLLQQKVHDMIKGAVLELGIATLAENAPLVGAALLLEVPEDTILH